MTTWRDIINIIRKMFGTKDNEIAACLGVPPTSFSKVKNGRRPPSDHFLIAGVYRKIFDPTNGKSMVARDPKYKKSSSTKPEDIEKECLSDLKKTIEICFSNVRFDMDYCWNQEDYKSFVMELLKLASLSVLSKDLSNHDYEPAPAKDALSVGVASEVDIRAERHLQQREPQAVDESLNGTPIEDSQGVNCFEIGKTESKAVGHSPFATATGGAQLHIEDKYRCCCFCTKWRGIMEDELAVCRIFRDQRTATDGSSCKYYEPDEGRIAVETLRQLSS